ncbi:MAG: helix-turn-helix transcriptional regulator [Clostridia bacterium]|nr:helix-turn-helix transcriptional regulator [Clostridia bacterium]
MTLNFSPPPEFLACSTKIFAPGEVHVTRLCDRMSVLILMRDGVLRFREDGELVELGAGEYYVQRHGLFQEGVPLEKPPSYFYIEFQGAYSEAENLPLRGRFQGDSLEPLLSSFEELFKSHPGNPFLLNAYMNRVFSELWAGSPRRDAQEHVTRLIRNDLRARFAEQIRLEEIARRFGYDKDYLTRVFKKQYGITPHQYQIQIRMEHAQWLLDHTSLSVKEIAYSVGYQDFSAFYRSFRNTAGYSPQQRRRLMGASSESE